MHTADVPVVTLFFVNIWIPGFFSLFVAVIFNRSCSEDEERLVRDLFRDYNKLIRPVRNINESLEVTLGISFFQLLNVDEKNQVMKTNVWINLLWEENISSSKDS
ncbi:Acetylcholine receptor subunit beta-like 1 [Nymphon striatum]|nr:Acetylcholine receptor subunit beta-like 1 [Nymphon striatum]